MKQNELINFMINHNFNVSDSDIFNPDSSEFNFMYNDDIEIGIIIKKYNIIDGKLDFDSVNNDVREVKSMLNKEKYNIWNIYFFITIENISNFEYVNYLIERNFKNLRKYIIRSIKDLKRIPFLEYAFREQEKIHSVSDLYELIIDSTNNRESERIINEILNDNGVYSEFSKQKINKILESIFEKGV